MKKNILQQIIETKFKELEDLKKKYKNVLKNFNTDTPSAFKKNFIHSQRVKIIAEIKPASPSEGTIFIPTKKKIKQIASLYSGYPVGAISVLTDNTYFQGAFENIALVKEVTSVPILCKEFIIDKFQIKLAKYFGADAILLIAEALPLKELIILYQFAKKINLDVLFEFHLPENLNFILKHKINIIGINNRNLETMDVDTNKCINLRRAIPNDKIVIAESGYNTKKEIRILEKEKFNGVLIGTSLLKNKNIGKKLQELVYYYE